MREPGQGSGLAAIGLLLAAVLGVVALAAPFLTDSDPEEIVDSIGGRHLPPGSRAYRLDFTNGRRWLVGEIEEDHGTLRVVHAGRVREVDPDTLVAAEDGHLARPRFFPLGTDHLGRDCWSRILYGGRVSLLVGLAAAALAAGLGLAIGGTAGAAGGWVDSTLMRLADAVRSFPRLFLVLALAALFDAGDLVVVLVLGGTGWMGVSRLVRAEVLRLKAQDFVLAAKAAGSGPVAVAWRHLLRNALTPLLSSTALRVGNVILVEAALSYLGMGIQPPRPTWGNMIYDGSEALVSAWWVSTFPGLAIVLTVIAFNMLGDGLRDRLDPRISG